MNAKQIGDRRMPTRKELIAELRKYQNNGHTLRIKLTANYTELTKELSRLKALGIKDRDILNIEFDGLNVFQYRKELIKKLKMYKACGYKLETKKTSSIKALLAELRHIQYLEYLKNIDDL